MTQERLKEIENREKEASVGPWTQFYSDVVSRYGTVCSCKYNMSVNYDTEMPNAQFIAHARQDIPDLVAEVKKLRKAIEHYAKNIGGTLGSVARAALE